MPSEDEIHLFFFLFFIYFKVLINHFDFSLFLFQFSDFLISDFKFSLGLHLISVSLKSISDLINILKSAFTKSIFKFFLESTLKSTLIVLKQIKRQREYDSNSIFIVATIKNHATILRIHTFTVSMTLNQRFLEYLIPIDPTKKNSGSPFLLSCSFLAPSGSSTMTPGFRFGGNGKALTG